MSVYTEEELALAGDIAHNARALVTYVINKDEVRLHNALSGMIEMALATRYRKPVDAPRRRAVRGFEVKTPGLSVEGYEDHEAVLLERVGEVGADVYGKIVSLLQAESGRAAESRMRIASAIIRLHDDRRDYLDYFSRTVTDLYNKLSTTGKLGEAKRRLREAEEKEVSKSDAPFKDKGAGEILYHLDMAARHLDVLVDYTAVAGHEDELLTLSAEVQKLAQIIRAELRDRRGDGDDLDVQARDKKLSEKQPGEV
jgi:hypothetical protein